MENSNQRGADDRSAYPTATQLSLFRDIYIKETKMALLVESRSETEIFRAIHGMESFKRKGRFAQLMERIPVHIILCNAALVGPATYGLERFREIS